MKTIMPVMLLLVSALMLAACVAGPANLDLQSGESNQDDWQTYTSTRYSFTVQFPSDWQVVELPTAEYPTATDQVWFVSEALPPPQTGARADIVLLFTQEDPSPSWQPDYFDQYQSDAFRLGELEGRRISGVNKESLGSELVVLVQIGDRYLQASPNQGEASLKYFDRVISSLRFAPTQAPTPPPPATTVPESLDEQTVVFEGTSFTCPAWLAEDAAAQRIPEYVDPSGFMYDDLPEHVRFDLLNSYAERAPLAGLPTIWAPWLKHQTLDSPEMQPQIFILPTTEYAAISPLAAERIELLRTLLDGGILPAGEELPVLPTFNSAQDVRGQVQPVAFDGGRGLRFIARYSQETMPVVNPAVFYTFQGLTDDGRYYVAAFFPLYVALLPDQIAVEDWEAFNITYAAYLSETTAALEGLAPAEFAPDLTSLDAVIASLRVDPQGLSFLYQAPPPAGHGTLLSGGR
jgi:hypothetical protein